MRSRESVWEENIVKYVTIEKKKTTENDASVSLV